MVVVGAVVAADLIREDAGLASRRRSWGWRWPISERLAPSWRIDVSLMLGFHETLVRLLIGVLFVLVAASVSPSDVAWRAARKRSRWSRSWWYSSGPVAVILGMWRTRFTPRERAFVAWMAPRGIVAGATASAFGPQLEKAEIAGAGDILPIVFVAIFGTVVLYGLTAAPVARRLGVAGEGRARVLSSAATRGRASSPPRSSAPGSACACGSARPAIATPPRRRASTPSAAGS